MHLYLVLAAILLAAQSVIPPTVARACSCGPWAIVDSVPENGARDVPLNRALVLEGTLLAESIKLEDANGSQVEFDLEHGPTPGCRGTWAELVPRAPLAPRSEYRIRVASSVPSVTDADRNSLTFTTGTTMLPEQNLTPPKGRASVVRDAPQSGLACGPTIVMACVSLDDYAGVEMVARRGDEIIMRWLFDEDSMDPNFGFDVVPDCLEFRRRAPTGQRSAPFTICGESLGTRAFVASDISGQVVRCRGGAIGEDPQASDAGARTQDGDAAVAAVDTGPEATAPSDPELSRAGCAAGPQGRMPAAPVALLLLALAAASHRLRKYR